MEFLFDDELISATDLSTFTAFFNPDSGSAFTKGDWEELMTSPAPPINYYSEIDKYWDKGPFMSGPYVVDHWWVSGEANPCTQCVVAFQLTIPPGIPDYAEEGTFFFGYIP